MSFLYLYAVKIVSKIPETLVAKHRYLESLENPPKTAVFQKSAKTI
jgi:hypothetical protein